MKKFIRFPLNVLILMLLFAAMTVASDEQPAADAQVVFLVS